MRPFSSVFLLSLSLAASLPAQEPDLARQAQVRRAQTQKPMQAGRPAEALGPAQEALAIIALHRPVSSAILPFVRGSVAESLFS